MKKETLIQIILGTVGGLIFSIGMCMCLIPEWNMFTLGVVTAIIGAITLLAIIPVYKKNHPKKEHKVIDTKRLITWIVGTVGILVMGFGMSKVLGENHTNTDMVIGLITGVIGLITCVLNYPVYSYIKSKKD